MKLTTRFLQAVDALAEARQNQTLRQQEKEVLKQDIADMGFLQTETDPIFLKSPAAKIVLADVALVHALPTILRGIQKQEGPPGYTPVKGVDYVDGLPGEPGYTPVKGVDYVDGLPGEPGLPGGKGDPGDPAIANMAEVQHIADEKVAAHEQKYDHHLLHNSKILGSLEFDESTIKEGAILQVRGKKLVCIEIPKVEKKQFLTASQGTSNVRSFTVTESRELDAMGIYVIDASAGNITMTIPSASGRENYWFELIRIDSSTNTVTVVPTGSETMSGMTDYLLQQWTDIKLFAYSGNYLLRSAS